MNVLGVCAGQGVMLYPFRKYLLGNIEPRGVFYTKNNNQWKGNFGIIPMVKSIEEMPVSFRGQTVDVIIGHPDCGHSSMLAYSRAKKLSDPLENHSLLKFIKTVNLFKPKLFLMENLEKFLTNVGQENFENTMRDFKMVYITGSVSNFGNSQKTRKRLVIVGVNKTFFGKNTKKITRHFRKVYPVNEIRTTGKLIDDLMGEDISIGHIREDIDSVITMYAGQKYSLREIRDKWVSKPGTSRWEVSDRKFTTAPAVYRNVFGCYPATARKSNRQFNPRGLQMSPRELARIQGIPDGFKIYFEPENLLYWINKGRLAVTKTPPMEISTWFKRRLSTLPIPIN